MDANLVDILKEVEITKDELVNQIVEELEKDQLKSIEEVQECLSIQEIIDERQASEIQVPKQEQRNACESVVYDSTKNLDNIDQELDFEDEEEEDDQSVTSIKSLNSEDGVLDSPAEDNRDVQDGEEGEASEGEDLEEGEVKEGAASAANASATAGGPNSSPPKPLTCKFFVRGYCQYGANCRFLHPGFSKDNKGKYTMFEPPKFPMTAHRPPPRPHFFGPMFRPPFPPGPMPFHARMPMRPGFMPPPRMPPAAMEPPAPKESAWERGLRHAKERMKEASRRKEEPDFEEKRLNMTYDGAEGDEDKEEGFPSSKKIYKDSEDSFHEDAEYAEEDKYRYDRSRRHSHSKKRHMKLKKTKPISFKEFYERERAYRKYRQYRKKQKEIKWKKQVYGEYNPSKGSKADEWHDPWRRSKSPHSRRSFSREGSSYSSESFSDNSGSYSGSSFSNTPSFSSGSRSRSRSPSYPPYGGSPPKSSRGKYTRGGRASGAQTRKRALSPEFPSAGGRAKRMRPSPGASTYKKQMSPNIKISIKNFSPKKDTSSSPIGAAKSRSRSASRSLSRSPSRSSGSRSRSGSYSMSLSGSKSSGSSSSRSPSPEAAPATKACSPPSPAPADKAATTAAPAVDNCKQPSPPPLLHTVPLPSPQPEKVEPVVRFVPSSQDKQHIKLTLLAKKNALEPSPLDLDVDPPLPPDPEPPQNPLPPVPPPSQIGGLKANSSRREELLKQLKAVEDAIARKRVKP